MGKALYRTYRSKKLSEIVGQEHITQALSNALKQGAISHAYLFTGPRGTGKTSIARILAHEINNLPYEDDSMHLDIIEIDAASNRRIDEIRDLRDKVHVAPSQAKYKVYIIDEVHMLTREAFNALLKTLEEPPAHVVFILATTEFHKLPETIVSRTQRFAFKPVDLAKVAAHLKYMAAEEKIVINDAALKLVAAHGEGSFRDSISLLDQTRSVGHDITATDVESILGIASTELITAIITALGNHDAPTAITTLYTLYEQGSDPAHIAKQLATRLRDNALAGQSTLPHEQFISLLSKLIEVPASSDPRTYLEVLLLDIALVDSPIIRQTPTKAPPSPPTNTSESTKPQTPPPATKKPADKTVIHPGTPQKLQKLADKDDTKQTTTPKEPASKATPETAPDAPNDTPATAEGSSDATLDASIWPMVLTVIKKKYNTLYSIVKTAEPHFEPGVVTLEFGFAFHQKRINEARNKTILSEAIQGVTGESLQINCTLGKPKPVVVDLPENNEISHTVAETGASAAPAENTDYYVRQAEEEAAKRPLNAISNIFGGGELLES